MIRFSRIIRRPGTRFSLRGFVVASGTAGAMFWSTSSGALELSNTDSFRCHEMRSTVSEESTITVHYRSASGVEFGFSVPLDLAEILLRGGKS